MSDPTPEQIEAAARLALRAADEHDKYNGDEPIEAWFDDGWSFTSDDLRTVARAALTAAAQVRAALAQETSVEWGLRWESGEFVGPIDRDDARSHHNPGNPTTVMRRTVICTPWVEADETNIPCDCAETGRIWCCMPDKHVKPSYSRERTNPFREDLR